MKKVTFEFEEVYVLYAVASEVAEELDRPKKTTSVYKVNWSALAKIWPLFPKNSRTAGPPSLQESQ